MKKNEDKDVQRKATRGGTRKGSGAKPKYGEQTKTIAFRVPMSKIEHVKNTIKTMLDDWAVLKRETNGYNGNKESRNE